MPTLYLEVPVGEVMGVVIGKRVLVGVVARKEVRDWWRRSKTGEGEGSENSGSPDTSMQL